MPAVAPSPVLAPQRHSARLVSPDRSFRLEAGTVSIGRAPDNHLVIDDRRVSRHHADLSQTEGRWIVHDLGSTNGTAVNGRLVKQSPLRDGDRLSLGGFEVTLRE
jgi:pSer/pThr/pTyr-binding forkhead associated (FHA) protein